GRDVVKQQRDPCGGHTVIEAFRSDLCPVIQLLCTSETTEESAAVDNIGAEFVEDSDTVGLRRGFDQTGQDELEERFVIDDVESQSCIDIPDGVDENPGTAGLHHR